MSFFSILYQTMGSNCHTYTITMDFKQKQYIFNRVSEEFNVSRVKKRYYCDKISLEQLSVKFLVFHSNNAQIFVLVDHIVVKASNELWVCQLPPFLDVSIYCVRYCSGAYFPLVRILILGTKSRAGFLTQCMYRVAGSRIFMLRINGQGRGSSSIRALLL